MPSSLIRICGFHHTPLLNFGSLILIPWFVVILVIHLFGLSPYRVLECIPLYCPFRAISGIPCPGCGMTRAFLALAEGDFLGALRFNPLSIPLFAFLVISSFNIHLTVYQRARDRLLTVLLFMVLLWWFSMRLVPAVFM